MGFCPVLVDQPHLLLAVVCNCVLCAQVGQVFHPNQDRIVSVRECARSQVRGTLRFGVGLWLPQQDRDLTHNLYSSVALAISVYLGFSACQCSTNRRPSRHSIPPQSPAASANCRASRTTSSSAGTCTTGTGRSAMQCPHLWLQRWAGSCTGPSRPHTRKPGSAYSPSEGFCGIALQSVGGSLGL